jgi:dTDP-4-amino-4,6-dideoxygalactose transaminase
VNKKKYKKSHNLSKSLISLPIDHRYKKEDIRYMVSILHEALKI